jgi:hypothetical protein
MFFLKPPMLHGRFAHSLAENIEVHRPFSAIRPVTLRVSSSYSTSAIRPVTLRVSSSYSTSAIRPVTLRVSSIRLYFANLKDYI